MLQSHAQTQWLKSNSHYFSLHLIVWVSPLEAFPASSLALPRCLQNLVFGGARDGIQGTKAGVHHSQMLPIDIRIRTKQLREQKWA